MAGCATIFGWDIHAPGILSENFSRQVQPMHQRIGLYLPKELLNYQSTARGGRTADPQTYHVGEALGPILIEAFQTGFDELIVLETEPTLEILRHYGIPVLAVIRLEDFENDVTWRGQAIRLTTETALFDAGLNALARFESKGTSDAARVFSKQGGPEVNLNAAIENNTLAIVQYLQDSFRHGIGKGDKAS